MSPDDPSGPLNYFTPRPRRRLTHRHIGCIILVALLVGLAVFLVMVGITIRDDPF